MRPMKTCAVLLAFGFLAATAAQAAPPKSAPAKAAPGKSAPAKTDTKPAAKTASSDKTTKKTAKDAPPPPPASPSVPDLVYATLQGFRPLTLDLYLPPPVTKNSARNMPKDMPKNYPKPLLVFVHGGAWNSGDARQGGGFKDFPGVLAALAAKGYVVASVNYRLSGEAHFPAALQDVKAAIRWLRGHGDGFQHRHQPRRRLGRGSRRPDRRPGWHQLRRRGAGAG